MATVDYQIASNDDDGHEAANGVCKTDLAAAISDAVDEWHCCRWPVVTIPNGATIDVATLDCYIAHASLDEPNHTVDFVDALNPAVLAHDPGAGSADYSSRTGTTATATAGDGSDQGGPNWFSALSMGAVDIEPIISELVASYDYSGGSAMMMRMRGSANAAEDLMVNFHNENSIYGFKLHIEYTAGGAEEEDYAASTASRHLMTLRGE